MSSNFKITNKIRLHNGFFKMNEITLSYKKYDGSWSNEIKREIFGGAEVSALLPYDPIKKEIVLIQQFRAGAISRYDNSYLYEIVAGIIGKNEKPEETALRECEEETGCVVKKITPIHSYFPAPGSSESFYHLFIGEVDSFDGKRIKGLNNENEDILVSTFKVSEVHEMLKKKIIKNGLTLIALQWFFLNYYKD